MRVKAIELNVDYGGNDEGEDDGDDRKKGARHDVTEKSGESNLCREGLLDVMTTMTVVTRHSHKVFI